MNRIHPQQEDVVSISTTEDPVEQAPSYQDTTHIEPPGEQVHVREPDLIAKIACFGCLPLTAIASWFVL